MSHRPPVRIRPCTGSPPRDPEQLFDTHRLTALRDLRGVSRKQLAELVGITPTAISQFEAGTTRPKGTTLRKLEHMLGVEHGFFTPGRPLAPAGIDALFFRAPPRTRVGVKKTAFEVARLAWDIKQTLARTVEFPAVCLPALDQDVLRCPISAAHAVRTHWRLGEGPVPHVTRHVEAHGIPVLDLPDGYADEDMDAYSYNEPSSPIIVLVPQRPGGNVYRRRFTVAHELGHLIMHTSGAGDRSMVEREANRFAAQFLAPLDVIREQLPQRFSLPRLTELSREWGLSLDALVYRCAEVGFFSQATTRRAIARIRTLREQGELHEPSHIDFVGEQPVLMQRAAQMAAEIGVGLADIAAELRRAPAEVRPFVEPQQPKPRLRLVT